MKLFFAVYTSPKTRYFFWFVFWLYWLAIILRCEHSSYGFIFFFVFLSSFYFEGNFVFTRIFVHFIHLDVGGWFILLFIHFLPVSLAGQYSIWCGVRFFCTLREKNPASFELLSPTTFWKFSKCSNGRKLNQKWIFRFKRFSRAKCGCDFVSRKRKKTNCELVYT